MRKTVVALALICVAAYALAQDSALKVGSIVAARWDDGGQSAPIPFGMFTTDVAAASSGAKSFVLWHKGSRVGEIDSNGRVWKDGSIIDE
jgi:hypothetical protein